MMRRPILLTRPKLLDDGEFAAASAAGFDVVTSRLDVQRDDVVVARHFAWPWPAELFGDLARLGAHAINGRAGYEFADDITSWAAALGDLTPETWTRFEALPERGPFVLKGLKADKASWARMFAETRRDAIELRSLLHADTGLGGQTIVARRYVPLVRLGVNVGGLPISQEYRVFVAFGRELARGFYWCTEDCETPPPPASTIPADFLRDAIERVGDAMDFYTLDVGLDVTGRWWVIEVSDGLRAGLSEVSPTDLYGALAARLRERFGDGDR